MPLARHRRKRGEVVRTRTTVLQMHTRQWVGTYAGKGNGDYRGELASALQAITAYLKHFAFRARDGSGPSRRSLWRWNRHRSASAGRHAFRNAMERISTDCERPQIQLVLAHPPTARITRRTSGEVVELFDGGWLELGKDVSHVRVIVARHPAPSPEKDIPVGKRGGRVGL